MSSHRFLIGPVLLLGCCTPCPAGEGGVNEWLDLAFSRNTAKAHITIERRSAFVLRADRDVNALSVEFRPTEGVAHAGDWKLELYPLKPTLEVEPPRIPELAAAKPIWRRSGAVGVKPAVSAVVRSGTPRNRYENWLLLAEPVGAAATPVVMHLSATPINANDRVRWLMQIRAAYDPDKQHDLTRATILHLTDDEVRHWTGLRNRQVFLAIWRRMTSSQIAASFPGPERIDLMQRGHPLPNGLMLHSNVAPPRSGPQGARRQQE